MKLSLLRFLVPCVALLCALTTAAPARAADSLAPPGAPRNWLPNEDWVQEHWLPYDQNTLFQILGVNLEQVREYFASGKNDPAVPTLAALAQSRGLSVPALANELVAAWHPQVSSQQYAVLVDRATRTLTQGHLMQHMLFHTFHDKALFQASPEVFGVSPHDLNVYHTEGLTHVEVGVQHGRTYQQMAAAATAVLTNEQAMGVQAQVTPPSEAQTELAYQLSKLPAWLNSSGLANAQTEFDPSVSRRTRSRFASDASFLGTSNVFARLTSSCCCCCCCCGGGAGCSSVEL
jgi:hypothetical protein